MKTLSLAFVCCLLATLLHARPAPEPWTPEFSETLRGAAEAYSQRDFDAALAKLDEADTITPDVPAALNLRGAIYTEKKEYAKGAATFEKALKLDPDLFAAQFNLGEIDFLQRKYAEARKRFEAMAVKFPNNELLAFKIFLTYLMQKKDKEAQAALDEIKFPSDTPAYYFAHAAWEFAHDNPQEAANWMGSSLRVFQPQQNLLYATTMYDLGWLKERPQIKQPGE